jgi:hypothetical protein
MAVMSVLSTGRALLSRNIFLYSYLSGLSNSLAIILLDGLTEKKINNLAGNSTPDLPACSCLKNMSHKAFDLARVHVVPHSEASKWGYIISDKGITNSTKLIFN